MADTIQLAVVTPAREVLAVDTAEILSLPGRDGLIGVLPGHCPLMTLLGPGIVACEGGKSLAIDGGFALIQDDVVTVLAEAAQGADEIDLEAARSALVEAQTALEALPENPGVDEETVARDRVAVQESRIELVARA